MKRFFRKIPTLLIVSVIILIVVAFTVFAATVSYDVTGDGYIDNEDILAIMNSITGKELLANENIADYNEDGVIDILDVILLKKNMFSYQPDDHWTIGIY